MRLTKWVLLAAVVSSLAACSKSTGEYLRDLDAISPENGDVLDFDETGIIFDAGQLGHEALSGLATTDQMTLAQAMRSLAHACKFLGLQRDNALLQADAAVLIGHLVSRVPIPPITEELSSFKGHKPAMDEFTKLLKAREPLLLESSILGLDSGDQVVVSESLAALKEKTGQDFGRDVDAWRNWYETVRDDQVAQFIERSREPLENLGNLKYRNASQARAVLGVLSVWFADYNHPELDELARASILKVGRQASVHALAEAMSFSKDRLVKADVADAMAQFPDPAFAEPLRKRLERERDPATAAKMIRALRYYPGRSTIEAIITSMSLDHPQVNMNAAQTLRGITGEDLGGELDAWLEWWKEEGSKSWP